MSEVTKKGENVTSREARCGSSGGLLNSSYVHVQPIFIFIF